MTEAAGRGRRWLRAGLLLTGGALVLVFIIIRAGQFLHPEPPLPALGTVSDFTLTNQTGGAVALADLRGHVWVADIIFTRCAGPCLRMSHQMKELQQALPADSQAKLISLTTDPDYDTPPVLATYAKRFDADPSRWTFLTGTKAQIAGVAEGSLKLAAVERKPAEQTSPQDLFIHSTMFVVVDKRARLRGIFETTGEDVDPAQVKTRILKTVARLERES